MMEFGIILCDFSVEIISSGILSHIRYSRYVENNVL